MHCRHSRLAILKRRAVGINLAIVELEHDHYYQPAFTLVGAGVYPLARMRRGKKASYRSASSRFATRPRL